MRMRKQLKRRRDSNGESISRVEPKMMRMPNRSIRKSSRRGRSSRRRVSLVVRREAMGVCVCMIDTAPAACRSGERDEMDGW